MRTAAGQVGQPARQVRGLTRAPHPGAQRRRRRACCVGCEQSCPPSAEFRPVKGFDPRLVGQHPCSRPRGRTSAHRSGTVLRNRLRLRVVRGEDQPGGRLARRGRSVGKPGYTHLRSSMSPGGCRKRGSISPRPPRHLGQATAPTADRPPAMVAAKRRPPSGGSMAAEGAPPRPPEADSRWACWSTPAALTTSPLEARSALRSSGAWTYRHDWHVQRPPQHQPRRSPSLPPDAFNALSHDAGRLSGVLRRRHACLGAFARNARTAVAPCPVGARCPQLKEGGPGRAWGSKG